MENSKNGKYGYQQGKPEERGYQPTKSQNGYQPTSQPTTSQSTSTPPSTGWH